MEFNLDYESKIKKWLTKSVKSSAKQRRLCYGLPSFSVANLSWLKHISSNFSQGFQNCQLVIYYVKIGPSHSMSKLCLACLLNFADQTSWAEPSNIFELKVVVYIISCFTYKSETVVCDTAFKKCVLDFVFLHLFE